MATRGRKPKPPALKLVAGNPGRRPIPNVNAWRTGALFPEIEFREEPLKPYKKLTKVQERLWKRFIDTAWWLTDHDVPLAYMWVCLQAEFDKKPTDMISSRLTQLRLIDAELGLDPGARSRLTVGFGKREDDPTEKFFK